MTSMVVSFLMLAQTAGAQPANPASAATNPAAGSPPTDATAGLSGISLWDYIKDGGLISYVMIVMSIIALALIIRNAMYLRRTRHIPLELAQKLDVAMAGGSLDEAARACAGEHADSFLARVMGMAIERVRRSAFGNLELRSSVEDAGAAETERMHRMNDFIGIIAAVGPMLGLLGTVVGMIGAFRTIGTLTGAARSTQLATFMSMALVNTAEGLIVAIPCTIMFAIYRRRIEEIVDDSSRVMERLISHMSAAAPTPAPRQAARPVAREVDRS
ncbi:MAG: MotA/TolQ/ExbB proton channel family protein [Phycisphaerales bacterium]|nr:MotA/TolQ/ExbB proton channel family protein [Phycisphaerales bacterium]